MGRWRTDSYGFWRSSSFAERLWFSPDTIGVLPLWVLIPLVVGLMAAGYYVITPAAVHETEDIVTLRCARHFFENARELGGVEVYYESTIAIEGSDREDRHRPRALGGYYRVRDYSVPLAPFYEERPEPASATCVLITNTGFGTSCDCWMPTEETP